MRISHATTKKIEYYVIGYDNKEFKVKIIDIQRHHKDHPEFTTCEITQEPSQKDRIKIHELLKEVRDE